MHYLYHIPASCFPAFGRRTFPPRLQNGASKSDGSEGKYYGGKWGVHVRAPDLWFRLIDNYGDHFVPLGRLAEVRFGVKSGKDIFFYPVDCSQECLQTVKDAEDFVRKYGVPRKAVESAIVILVRCGESEAKYTPSSPFTLSLMCIA